MTFKPGDRVKLSAEGVKYFCSDWEEYDVPHSMYCGHWGEVVSVEHDSRGRLKVWVDNAVGSVFYYANQLELVEFAEKEVEENQSDVKGSALDIQVGGEHYKSKGIQPVEYAFANNLGFAEANIVKYVSRHQDKNGAEDIKKAIHYCKFILEFKYGIKE